MASDKPSTPDHIENPPPHRLDETRELTSPGPERYFEPFENLNPDRVPPRPIVVHRRRGEQGLWVIGVDHTYDPNHENYRVLDQRVQKLRGGGAERKRVILHEGRPRRALADLATSIVSQDAGEVGALYWYAKEYKIPIEPTEPEGYPEARGLQKRFDRDAIMLYYWSRQIPQWNRSEPEVREEFEPYMEATLGRYHKAFGKDPFWAGFDFSNQNLLTIYDRFYPERPFERYDSDFFLSQTVELWKSDTEVQRIAQAANHPRDKNLATTLQRYWKAGWSGLCAFGWQHVWRIKPFLDTLGEQG